ncbi:MULTISPECIES: hypothetical protein [Paenibacillus]|uniref:Uncharacterized protein n=1 Tax=Paenibacillus peoriae TaxID=59893 RepID=A0A7H0Y2Z5_9BACL|nr:MULTISPECIES: hypothetical protein [Paenibacillus]KAF6630577.1 hypothetical protein H6F38_14205 [Paenibacillus sp. EKM208P]QNR65453.1 hypothetical protein IAQ67_16295 [Paenibacillus peoriae]
MKKHLKKHYLSYIWLFILLIASKILPEASLTITVLGMAAWMSIFLLVHIFSFTLVFLVYFIIWGGNLSVSGEGLLKKIKNKKTKSN